MEIGFLGFGEAARAFHETLSGHDSSLGFSGYDLLLDAQGAEGACGAAMRARSIVVAANPEALARRADWIISAVTADQSAAAAVAVAPYLRSGQTFIDINSVSPDTKRASCAAIERSGATYLDMAVMAPVHPLGHRTPVLIAGADAEALAARLTELDFAFGIEGAHAGAATAVKMIRSLFVKGLEALTVETLLAADAAGCFDTILASISRSYPGLGWPDFAAYQFERTTRHGLRRAAEMEESARTLGGLGRSQPLAQEIAAVQRRMGARDPEQAESLERVRALLARSVAAGNTGEP